MCIRDSYNAEAGQVWLNRIRCQWPNNLWINPVKQNLWGYTQSIEMIKEIFENKMVPMTLEGLEQGMKELAR